ncbi:MAG: S8 family serine peptidase [Dehalococcoidia bacterium]|nr:S8 family serine peptidase [Dehalococcoidia bacterium]
MHNRAMKITFALLAVLLLTACPIAQQNNQYALAEDPAVSSQPAEAEPGNPDSASASVFPDDSSFNKQWALERIHAIDAWQIISEPRHVLIAVLDTGIDREHEDLAGRVGASANFSSSQTSDDANGHGTHIAGIIGAVANNRTGIAGVAPNVSLLNVKVADDAGFTDAEAVARGIIWAVDNGAKVINISLTLTGPERTLEEAVSYAWNKGAILVAAAGNTRGVMSVYPAHYAHTMAVTSTDSENALGQLANRGDWVDVAAPGVNIYSTLPGNSYGYKSGTSMAAAYVSGVAGLLFGVVTDTSGNGLLNDEVRNIIERSTTGNLDIANGRVDALKAVQAALTKGKVVSQ